MSATEADIQYGPDSQVPTLKKVILSFQHLILLSSTLLYPLIISNSISASEEIAQSLICFSMIASGIATILMSLNQKYVGSGFLLPQSSGAAFIQPSILAAKAGGFPLVFGMTFMAGILQTALSGLMRRLQKVFTSEVSGLVIMMVGISLAPVAISQFMGLSASDQVTDSYEMITSIVTICTIIAFQIWGTGQLRLYSFFAGIAIGYVLSIIFGLISHEQLDRIIASPFIAFPDTGHIGFSFQTDMILPFAIAAISVTLKSSGDLLACQKIADANWRRPEFASLGRGVFSSGLGNILAGLLGAMGQATMSSNIGFSKATGALNRKIGIATGILLILLAFNPKLSIIIAYMPAPVMGATLILLSSFIIITGMQVIMSRLLDSRKTFVIGISLLFGLSVEINPDFFLQAPDYLQPVLKSSISVSTLMALCLNLFFRIGIYKRKEFVTDLNLTSGGLIESELKLHGATWGASREVIDKAIMAVNEFIEIAWQEKLTGEKIKFYLAYDEFHLRIDCIYKGKKMDIDDTKISREDLMNSEKSIERLSIFMLKQYTDKLKFQHIGNMCRLRIEINN